MKKAFTLAEVMIVLSVIGVLTAILLPNAFQNVPKESLLKFKKANNTLGSVIREITNSDKYFVDGNLGCKAGRTDCVLPGNNNDKTATAADNQYLCNAMADVLSVKSVNCKNKIVNANYVLGPADDTSWNSAKTTFDSYCKKSQSSSQVGAEIVTTDGITYFQSDPGAAIGYSLFKDINKSSAGMQRVYKVLCFDVDTLNDTCVTTPTRGKNICPFGYGLRSDGRLVPGAQADNWMQMGINNQD